MFSLTINIDQTRQNNGRPCYKIQVENFDLAHSDMLRSSLNMPGVYSVIVISFKEETDKIAALEAFLDSTAKAKNLEFVHIGHDCKIGDEGAKIFAKQLISPTEANVYTIFDHTISDVGAKAIATTLQANAGKVSSPLIAFNLTSEKVSDGVQAEIETAMKSLRDTAPPFDIKVERDEWTEKNIKLICEQFGIHAQINSTQTSEEKNNGKEEKKVPSHSA